MLQTPPPRFLKFLNNIDILKQLFSYEKTEILSTRYTKIFLFILSK